MPIAVVSELWEGLAMQRGEVMFISACVCVWKGWGKAQVLSLPHHTCTSSPKAWSQGLHLPHLSCLLQMLFANNNKDFSCCGAEDTRWERLSCLWGRCTQNNYFLRQKVKLCHNLTGVWLSTISWYSSTERWLLANLWSEMWMPPAFAMLCWTFPSNVPPSQPRAGPHNCPWEHHTAALGDKVPLLPVKHRMRKDLLDRHFLHLTYSMNLGFCPCYRPLKICKMSPLWFLLREIEMSVINVTAWQCQEKKTALWPKGKSGQKQQNL